MPDPKTGYLTKKENDFIRARAVKLVNARPDGIWTNDLAKLLLTEIGCSALTEVKRPNKSVGMLMGTAFRNDDAVKRSEKRGTKGFKFFPVTVIPEENLDLFKQNDTPVGPTLNPESEAAWCIFVRSKDMESTKALLIYQDEKEAKKYLPRWEINYPDDDILLAKMTGNHQRTSARETVPFKM